MLAVDNAKDQYILYRADKVTVIVYTDPLSQDRT
jgi:hypothetical protein